MRVLRGAVRVFLTLLPAAAALTAAEVVLLGLGLGGTPALTSRGFDAAAAYIVPDPARPGGWRTQMFDGTAPEREVPPRDPAKHRVLLFGGSNTGGFPPAALAFALDHGTDASTPRAEVINLGRAGYGSGRVAILFEQALALKPQSVVIYAGHNEFVEAGFEAEVAEHLSPTLRKAATAATGLRTFNALCDAIRAGGGAPQSNPTPKAWSGEFERFKDFTYDQTLAQLEQYRANLTTMCRMARERGIDVVICTVISNPLAPPFSSTWPPELSEANRRRARLELFAAHEAFPKRFAAVIADAPADRTHAQDWRRPARPLPPDGKVPTLREWPSPVRGGYHLIPPPEHWSDLARELAIAHEAFFARVLTDAERVALETARSHLETALAIVPDHPAGNFRLGAARWLLGDDQGARDAFANAARFDRAPRKGSDATNEIVEAVAASVEGVRFFDAAALYAQRAPNGLIGLELMKDECHLHERGYRVLMHDLADFMRGRAPEEGL